VNWTDFFKALTTFDWGGLLKTLAGVGIPAFALFKFGARQSALRDHIKGDLALVDEINKNALLRDQTGAAGWLQGKIVLDIARLSGTPLGTRKKPIPWSSVVFASLVTLGFGYWTLELNTSGFNWWSLLTGAVTVLFLISVLGMTTNRAIVPDKELPAGAVPVQSNVATEHVAGRVAALSITSGSPQFGADGVATCALDIFEQLQSGFLLDALNDVEPIWLECRIRSWLWNNQTQLGLNTEADLDAKLGKLWEERVNEPSWNDFVSSEAQQFRAAWTDFGAMGAGSTRRIVMPGVETVILAPIGATGGYYVPAAAAVPRALTFLMRKDGAKWRLLNHEGYAPPLPQWPPVWWIINDPALAATEAASQPALDLN